VHGTSLRNTNELVSGDNKGVASWLAENALRGEDAHRGVSALIDAFGSLNDNGAVFDSGDEGERPGSGGAENGGEGCDRSRVHTRR
jgi:neutral ceramidase